MRINLQTLSHEPLVWKKILPPHFKGVRLPGGTLASANGAFGSVCIQEIREKYFHIQYKVFDILQHFITEEKWQGEGLHSRLILKGQVQQSLNSFDQNCSYTNQLTITAAAILTNTFEKNTCITFDTFFTEKIIAEILSEYPALYKTIKNQTTQNPQTAWADHETFELVNSILHSKYKRDFRKLFYETRIRDMLFKYLVLFSGNGSNFRPPLHDEILAVHDAARIIDADITKHLHVHRLAAMVKLNRTYLQEFFKYVFGVGPYEYLLKQRMKKAKEMLEQGYSVKEIASKFGYRPSDFTDTFREHTGFRPSDIKIKKQ